MSVMRAVENLYHEIADPESLDLPARDNDQDGETRGDVLEATTPNQAELLARSEEVQVLRAALQRLDVRERVALQLSFGIAGEFAPEEIAQVLGVTAGTVGDVIRSARVKLRLHLQDAGVRG